MCVYIYKLFISLILEDICSQVHGFFFPWISMVKYDSLVAQMINSLPAMWETQVQSLGQEDPLEKKMATHSSILAWKIPRMEESGRLQSTGLQRVKHD